MKLYWILGILFPLLVACEGEFVGELPYNIEATNSPVHLLEVQNWRGTGRRLVLVGNTNFDLPRFQTGSLHFYEVGVGGDLDRLSELDLELPSTMESFFVYQDLLFVLDRAGQKLLIFEWGGEAYEPKENSLGQPEVRDTFSNPKDIALLEAQNGKDYLIVSHFDSGTLLFFDLEAMDWVDREALEDIIGENNLLTSSAVRRDLLIGGDLSMTPVDPQNMSLAGASRSQRSGFGTNRIHVIGGANDFFVVVSELTTALFGFRFDLFRNSANLLWYLRDEERGYREGNTRIIGSRDRGFRGSDMDGEGNIFLASRADDQIYRVTPEDFDFEAPVNTNTFAFDRDATNFALEPQDGNTPEQTNFVADRANEKFARVDALAVNGKDGAVAATELWVLSREGERGFEFSRLYRLSLTGDNPPKYRIENSYPFAANASPQRLLLLEDVDRILVSTSRANTIVVLNASTLDLIENLQ